MTIGFPVDNSAIIGQQTRGAMLITPSRIETGPPPPRGPAISGRDFIHNAIVRILRLKRRHRDGEC